MTFDIEEFDWPAERGRPLSPTAEMDVTEEGTGHVLQLLARHGTLATFFITAAFARARPERVRAIVEAGHEAAVHGLAHSDDYGTMDAAVALERLRESRAVIEAISARPARGVRTPRLRPCAPTVLRDAGFVYDASPHPTWVPGRYNGLTWPRRPWREAGVVRIPISVLPLIRVPVSWIWYRTAGPCAGIIAAGAACLGAPYLHVYFHAWEAVDIRPLGIPRIFALRTGASFLRALDPLLAWASTRMVPMTVGEFVRGLGQ
ncbi:MAG: polysaccharide deacetylase family protein [Deltaproteobacteria bacterium]|nr:polysaccharide deacetylase family protein [Deltaproteobacteria bacterium]